MKNRTVLTILVALLLVLIGCTSGSDNPASPDMTPSSQRSASGTNNTMLWGAWDIILDPASATAEIIPIRGVQFTANVTQFLQPPMSASHRMSIEISPDTDWLTGYVKVDVIFTHPFPGLDMYTGFDVRGVCIGYGSIPGIHDTDILYAGDNDLHVINQDGLTRWFNPSEFTTYYNLFGFTIGKLGTPELDWSATLNGYKYYCDGLESDTSVSEFFADGDCTNPRGYFSAGTANRRTYELQFPMDGGFPDFSFQYAVVASWEPALDDPVIVPESFNLSANCQEAYVLSTADLSDMYYSGGSYGGSLIIDVRVFDHQGAGTDPADVHSEIAAIHLETPSRLITSGGIATFDPAALDAALLAQDSTSATYHLEVANVAPTAAGLYDVLIAVENANPNTYDSGFPGFDFPDGAISAYLLTQVTVISDVTPTVIAIDPAEGDLGQLLIDVEVTGTDFIDSATVTLTKNDDPSVEIIMDPVVWVSETLITGDLDLDSISGVEIGVYDVTVTNPGGLFGTLADGFEVTEIGWPYWWESIMYNSFNLGYNPSATTPDPADLTEVYNVSAPNAYKYCTPVVAEDKIFFVGSTSFYANSNTRVYCHDLITGALKWSAQIDPSGYSQRAAPGYAFYDAGDGTERLIVGGDQIYCFDANATGNPTPLWTYDDTSPSDQNWLGTQLTVYEDYVIAKGRREAMMYILDAQDGSLIHEVPIMASFESGVSAKDGKAYAVGYNWGTHENYLDCVDIETGTLDWRWNSGYTTDTVDHYNNPLIDGDRAYFGTYRGRVYCIAVADHDGYSAGDMVWVHQASPGNPINGGVSKFGDDLFFATAFSGPVHCITDTGSSAAWKWDSANSGYFDAMITVTTTPSYPDGVVIAPEIGGSVYFLDATDGTFIRSISTGQTQRGGAAIVGDTVVVVGSTSLRAWN